MISALSVPTFHLEVPRLLIEHIPMGSIPLALTGNVRLRIQEVSFVDLSNELNTYKALSGLNMENRIQQVFVKCGSVGYG